MHEILQKKHSDNQLATLCICSQGSFFALHFVFTHYWVKKLQTGDSLGAQLH
jgi:hypothetical protein